jgi:hypothetical protein
MLRRGLICAAAVAVSVGAAVAPGVAAIRAKLVKPYAGRIYEATHGALDFQMQISASGRRVSVPPNGYLVACGRGRDKGQAPQVNASAGHANVTRAGAFTIALLVPGNPKLTITGQFLSRTNITGTVVFHGSGGPLKGCNVNERWSASLQPLNDYFSGQTSTGAAVTFEVSEGTKPQMFDFSVGGVPSSCPAAATTTTATTGQTLSIDSGFVGNVQSSGGFSARTQDANSVAFTVSGTIAGTAASGTVSGVDSSGCGYTSTSWTATLVKRGL